jgi:hypothetical protein
MTDIHAARPCNAKLVGWTAGGRPSRHGMTRSWLVTAPGAEGQFMFTTSTRSAWKRIVTPLERHWLLRVSGRCVLPEFVHLLPSFG